MINKSFFILCLTFFNLAVFADVKDDINKINELNESGILSEQDYKNLLEKSIIQTEEYKKIKGLFDSEIINLEDFEDFKNKIITKYSLGNILDEKSSETNEIEAAEEATDKAEAAAAEAADKAAIAAKEAADKAAAAKEVADSNIEVIRKKIGKVLKVSKGKGFADGKKLKRKNIVESGVTYSTLAGGDLHLILDEKTRIFIGYESEIIIRKFDVVEKKVHNVEIELVSGSFLYLSLRKTSTDLKVIIDKNILTSKGFETSVAFVKNEEEIRFVNAGKSALKFKDELFSFSQYAILDPISQSLTVDTIPNAKGDKLIGTALEDFSMTTMGVPAASSGGSNADELGPSAGGCG